MIKQWAESRGGKPATVEATEHGDRLGVLRFDFGGDNQSLRHVSCDEWFRTFDSRKLDFIYQEERSDGSQSIFFRLGSPEREDAWPRSSAVAPPVGRAVRGAARAKSRAIVLVHGVRRRRHRFHVSPRTSCVRDPADRGRARGRPGCGRLSNPRRQP